VGYGEIESNCNWTFSTSAEKFNRTKTDFARCGQAQKDLLPIGSKARFFWKKWDGFHLKNMTSLEYVDMLNDLEVLKKHYNHIIKDKNHPMHYINFSQLKDLSMQPVKK
jgi:hypothetical protein